MGKSTVSANLAVALAARGLRVGLVDADVFGFSIPGILGIPDAKPTQVGDMILPPVAHEVKVISIGMFVEEGAAVSWRGPLLHRTDVVDAPLVIRLGCGVPIPEAFEDRAHIRGTAHVTPMTF